MTQDTEQYRAGFEAWARDEGYSEKEIAMRCHGDYAVVNLHTAWRAWTASKREASTEPSARIPSDEAIERAALKHLAPGWTLLASVAKLDPDYKEGEQFARLKAVVRELAAGALSDDAKDAARLDHIEAWLLRGERRGFKWDAYSLETGKTARAQLDAAIEAHKAGSGK